jgi:mRNA interferase YafQ
MLFLKRTSQFKRDYKKALKQNRNTIELKKVIIKLSRKEQLEVKYNDHPLAGNYKSYRDCHIEPDWVLIYKLTNEELILVRLGSHSELFG